VPDVRLHPEPRAEILDERLLLLRLCALPVVEVQDVQVERPFLSKFDHEVQQRDRVHATAHAYDHLVAVTDDIALLEHLSGAQRQGRDGRPGSPRLLGVHRSRGSTRKPPDTASMSTKLETVRMVGANAVSCRPC